MAVTTDIGPNAAPSEKLSFWTKAAYAIGDLGESAYRFVDWLEKCGQSLWQVLPLGPTSFGDSPYQTLSAFAGNPLLVDLGRISDLYRTA